MKPVEFLGNALDELRAFPCAARRECGFQIDRLQNGLEPFDWKPLKIVGAGVREIRVSDADGAFRVIYVATFDDAIYVLHCFEKRTRQTRKADIDLAKSRYKALTRRERS